MRLQTIDVLRGVASLAVAMFHLNLASLGWVGVHVFFVISGFVIPYAMYKGGYTLAAWPRYLAKRSLRIEPPYLVAVALAVLLAYLSSLAPGYQGRGFDITILDVTLHAGYLVEFLGHDWANVVFWTLSIEFQYYLLMSLVFGLVVSANRNVRMLLLLGCLASGWLFSGYRPILFPWLSLFCIGIATFQFKIRLIDVPEMCLYYLASAATFWWVSPEDGAFNAGIGMVVGLLAGWVIAFVALRTNRIFTFLAAISFSLYLVHVPVGGRVINLGKRFVSDAGIEGVALSLTALGVSILAAWIFYRLVEKPAMNMAARISYRNAGAVFRAVTEKG
ncbi:MAG: acyltransferase [Proteobacteria bacterium]|jgi:peptidoglycan/LPS O-acetylase OafA/YrhL|nr:acyltransferase [Pseudomonadota bacterium]